MADQYLGKRLIAAGWDQGVLLPSYTLGLNFHLDDPVTRIGKSSCAEAEANYRKKYEGKSERPPRHAFAYGQLRQDDRLVIASQACDIDTSPSEEPIVVAMRAFTTDNTFILRTAGENSSRYFLLNPDQNLVADATLLVSIEKPILLELTPQLGVVDELTRERFGRWIAHRFSRPAIDEDVVKAVVAPILNNLRTMRETDDPLLAGLDDVREVRMRRLSGPPPYNVGLVLITKDNRLPDGGVTLAHLLSRMRSWLDPEKATFTSMDVLTMYQITAGDYFDTQKIYLDHYTYRGRTIRGLAPANPV